jgi:hypothetical protein
MLNLVKTEEPPSSLDTMLDDPLWRDTFERYDGIQDIKSTELGFLRKVEKFSESPTDVGLAKGIYDQYIGSSAPDEINIPGTTLKPLTEIFDDVSDAFDEIPTRLGDQDPATIFDSAVREAKKSLTDVYGRFILECNEIRARAKKAAAAKKKWSFF